MMNSKKMMTTVLLFPNTHIFFMTESYDINNKKDKINTILNQIHLVESKMKIY